MPVALGSHKIDDLHHDSNALSAIVGNTEDVRDRHYNGVAKPQEGRDYFAIMPGKN